MAGHTPGPWRIGNLDSFDAYTGKPFRNVWAGGGIRLDDPDAVCVARCIDNGNCNDDARLIAAAPDLLAACKRYLDAGDSRILWDDMKAAIAKAEAS